MPYIVTLYRQGAMIDHYQDVLGNVAAGRGAQAVYVEQSLANLWARKLTIKVIKY